MRRLNAFIAGVCLVAVIAPPHNLWPDLGFVILGFINGSNALWGPREES